MKATTEIPDPPAAVGLCDVSFDVPRKGDWFYALDHWQVSDGSWSSSYLVARPRLPPRLEWSEMPEVAIGCGGYKITMDGDGIFWAKHSSGCTTSFVARCHMLREAKDACQRHADEAAKAKGAKS